MNKVKPATRSKLFIVSKLSLVSIVLGIGCICWAFINIGAQSVNSADIYSNPLSSPTTSAVMQARTKGADAAPTKTGNPSAIFNAPMKTDPVSNKLNSDYSDKPLYPIYPADGDYIGSLSIPVLKQKLPIIQGTDADELKKGVGHFIQSVLPGEEDNCVLSGHRDTVFAGLGKLKISDQLIVQTSAGTFTYEIKHIRIVDKDDKTVIVPADHAVLTVTTCYPFHYVGSAPYRYILSADLVNK